MECKTCKESAVLRTSRSFDVLASRLRLGDSAVLEPGKSGLRSIFGAFVYF